MVKLVKGTKPEVNSKNYHELVTALSGMAEDCLYAGTNARVPLNMLSLVASKFHDGHLYNQVESASNAYSLGKSEQTGEMLGKIDGESDYWIAKESK